MNFYPQNNTELKKICFNIKILRLVKGLTQEEVSKEINIARSTYSAYESGAKIPDLQTLDALSEFYNINIESLLFHSIVKEGVFYKVYINGEYMPLRTLINNYQNLSVTSRNVVMERLQLLLHRESIFFDECD